VFLEVRESNHPALALYGALGFVELDRRKRYYADTDEDAVVMQRLLR
jgi:ribosomal-protein-alanine N-acetyltransferase